MNSRVFVLLVLALAAARCGSASDGAPTPAAPGGVGGAASSPSSGAGQAATGHGGASAATPHGDHAPHHGGAVLMAGDLHYEIVLKPAGDAELYLSDAVRTDLPASIVSDVALEIDRPARKTETIDMAIDGSGERWEGTGQPVKDDDATVRVAFTFRGDPVTVELPYRAYFKPAAKTAGAGTAASR